MLSTKRPILIVIGNYKNGGNAKQASMLANGFAQIGYNVAIVVTKEISKTPFFELENNVSLVDINNKDLQIYNKTNYNHYKTKVSFSIKAAKIASSLIWNNTEKKDLINFKVSKKRNHLPLGWILSMYKNPIIVALGLEYAVDVFGVLNKGASIILATKTYAEGELLSTNKNIATAVLRGVNCVVCQTHDTLDYFKNMGASNLEVIYNPMSMIIPPYIGTKEKRIVNFCRISKEKNLELLIEAFYVFHKQFPEYRVDIYGNVINVQEKAYKQELLDRISHLKMFDIFRIHPAEKNIHETVQNAAMFISTSDYEGLSNSMIEAMSLGIPCICTDCDGGGAREMIDDGVNGLLVPKNDKESLYKAMVRFAEDEKFAKKCGQNAAQIRNKTSFDTVISQWNSVINKYC